MVIFEKKSFDICTYTVVASEVHASLEAKKAFLCMPNVLIKKKYEKMKKFGVNPACLYTMIEKTKHCPSH